MVTFVSLTSHQHFQAETPALNRNLKPWRDVVYPTQTKLTENTLGNNARNPTICHVIFRLLAHIETKSCWSGSALLQLRPGDEQRRPSEQWADKTPRLTDRPDQGKTDRGKIPPLHHQGAHHTRTLFPPSRKEREFQTLSASALCSSYAMNKAD